MKVSVAGKCFIAPAAIEQACLRPWSSLCSSGTMGAEAGYQSLCQQCVRPILSLIISSAKDWPDNRERHAATGGLGSSGDHFSRQAWRARGNQRTIVSARSHLGIGIPTCLHRSRLSCQVRAFQRAIRNDRRQVAERDPAPPFAERHLHSDERKIVKLYYSSFACSLADHIALEEAGASFQREAIDLQTKRMASGHDFLTISAKDSGETLTGNGTHDGEHVWFQCWQGEAT